MKTKFVFYAALAGLVGCLAGLACAVSQNRDLSRALRQSQDEIARLTAANLTKLAAPNSNLTAPTTTAPAAPNSNLANAASVNSNLLGTDGANSNLTRAAAHKNAANNGATQTAANNAAPTLTTTKNTPALAAPNSNLTAPTTTAATKSPAQLRAEYARPVSQWRAPTLDPAVQHIAQEMRPLTLPTPPTDNPITLQKAALGGAIFKDPRLSRSGQIACQNCHHESLAFGDGLRLSHGHDRQNGRRNSPNIIASGHFAQLFWDGRKTGLEAQFEGPLTDPVEMASDKETAVYAVRDELAYYPLFVAAFGDAELKSAAAAALSAEFAPLFYDGVGDVAAGENAGENTAGTNAGTGANWGAQNANENAGANLFAQETSAGTARAGENAAMTATTAANLNLAGATGTNSNLTHATTQNLAAQNKPAQNQNPATTNPAAQTKPAQTKTTTTTPATQTPADPRRRELRALLYDYANISAKADLSVFGERLGARVRTELITFENIARAVATYERTLSVRHSRFERFLRGDYAALTDRELLGLDTFRHKGRCMNCHWGAVLSDGLFHNIGLSFYGRKLQDLGRYEVTGEAADVGAFKTPSLLRVAESAPYMHNGIFPTLRGILNMYNAGFPTAVPKERAADPLAPKTDPLVQKLGLTAEEIDALEAFLRTL